MTHSALRLGIDMGSTTVKCVVLPKGSEELLFSDYRRHDGEPLATLFELLEDLAKTFPDANFRTAFTGSQCSEYALWLDAPYIQEVISGSIAVSHLHPQTQTSIELGGQDAKILFFKPDDEGSRVHDMRMNGVCAGGTGAFLDQIATLLDIPVEEFNDFATRGKTLYDISGRCGVFAKTDIQPLLNQGVPREDIALSCLHALAKQTIGGLAQGMEIHKPIMFAGGPLFFMPRLIEVFKERLELQEGEYYLPENAQTIIAFGTALALDTALAEGKGYQQSAEAIATLLAERAESRTESNLINSSEGTPFFSSTPEREEFEEHYRIPEFVPKSYDAGTKLPVYIGIDAGSTTTKFMVLDESKEVVAKFYHSNKGKPIDTARRGLLEFHDTMRKQGVELEILGLGSTGYGEHLFAKAFGGDYHTVETIAHKEAACFYEPDVSFVLDLGGQDMKAIFIQDGIISDIVLNEACSAGCGSFIESYSQSLAIKAPDIANLAFAAERPSVLGSRCTVFMNSSIISEQKSGKTVNEILAGLCSSVIENLFTKVVRIPNADALGKKIVVQGGTFKNDAVLRAFSQYVKRDVLRPPHAGEMGALGIALLTMEHAHQWEKSHFIGFSALRKLSYEANEGDRCPYCANACARSVIRFNNGTHFVTGNRCERGEVIDTEDQPLTKRPHHTEERVADMMRDREKLLFTNYNEGLVGDEKGTIGIPMVLDFYDSLPFWATFFTRLGYKVEHSGRSSSKLFESGLKHIPSDTVCMPAKVVHGHIKRLAERGVKQIFFPAMQKGLKENKSADDSRYCALLQGYPEVIKISEFSHSTFEGVDLLSPAFFWSSERLKRDQVIGFAKETFDLSGVDVGLAFEDALMAQTAYQQALIDRGKEILEDLRESGGFGVLLAARPYHGDMFINHGVADLFTSKGIPVLINEGLELDQIDVSDSRIDSLNNFHSRMLAAARLVAKEPVLELTQVVSFGCGHDAVFTDEVDRVLRDRSDKVLLSLKLDEGENKGPLNIRITSFVETLRARRAKANPQERQESVPYEVLFEKKDRHREILVPNLSRSFTALMGEALADQGYTIRVLPSANRQAIDLGKKYVHNDICFPAQVNIGEHLAWLENNPGSADNVAVMLAKNCRDCRAGHYIALARKALDSVGYEKVPLLTTDFGDIRNIHPGFKINEGKFNLFSLRGMALIDALDDMQRKCRPYEVVVGSTDELHERSCDRVLKRLRTGGWAAAKRELVVAISDFNALETDRTNRRPRVGIIGEFLVNYHEASNYHVVEYLEQNGMEVVLPAVIEFWRLESIDWQIRAAKGHSRLGSLLGLTGLAYGKFLDIMIGSVEKRMKKFKYYEPHSNINEVANYASDIMDLSYRVGEGWLIPGEIISWIKKGIMAHLIVQPFGCLPNHISGRGVVKAIKGSHPEATILSLDFDPDTSLANIHNRLQMIILNASGKM